jgi:hypothetical protein
MLARTLARLSRLRELRLQDLVYAQIPGDTATISFPDPPPLSAPHLSPLYHVARTLAEGVSSLRRVVFLGGYDCAEVIRIGVRAGQVEEFWQETTD